jgi:hypothetical protein
MAEQLIIDKLERIWKEAVMAYSMRYPKIFLGKYIASIFRAEM